MPALTHSPADVVRWLLVALGLGTDPEGGDSWPVFAAGEPDSPDNCITVFDTVGTDDGRVMVTGEAVRHPGIQVRVRAKNHATGWAKADAIRTALAQSVYLEAVAVGGNHYLLHSASKIGNVLALGKESPVSKRSIFTLNCQVSVKQL